MHTPTPQSARFGLVIDVDRCTGCGTCVVACATENNVPPADPKATDRTGLTPMRVYRAHGGGSFPDARTAFFPVMCQHCEHHTPCVTVCPQNAVDVDPQTGVVSQVPARCLGCRYCMAACPYHARYFNWWDPVYPEGPALNPDVAPRMRGTVEKCNFCHGRAQAAQDAAAMEGKRGPVSWTPACVEACPAGALHFGNLADPGDAAARLASGPRAFRLLGRLGTQPKVVYLTDRRWVRALGEDAHGGSTWTAS